jgi:hypothetical protein
MSERVTKFAEWIPQYLGVSIPVLERLAWTVLVLLFYPAMRFYYTVSEGKPEARATPDQGRVVPAAFPLSGLSLPAVQ